MTYEYECCACGHKWEKEAPITAEPDKKCPQCSQESAKRLVSAALFVLKGSGWAADGYKGT
jgi:putative FmdB family regulatory protein